MEPISLGLTALSVGSSIFGMMGQKPHVDPGLAAMNNALSMQENDIRRQQMNLDAVRRKRDIVRNAQVASANATAVAYNQGAGQSSALSGALSGISGQAGTMTQGVTQNQELGNQLFDNKNAQALTGYQLRQQMNQTNTAAQAGTMVGNVVSNNQEDLTKLFKFGFSKI